jgi:hypothetical protein
MYVLICSRIELYVPGGLCGSFSWLCRLVVRDVDWLNIALARPEELPKINSFDLTSHAISNMYKI